MEGIVQLAVIPFPSQAERILGASLSTLLVPLPCVPAGAGASSRSLHHPWLWGNPEAAHKWKCCSFQVLTPLKSELPLTSWSWDFAPRWL